MRLIYFLPAVTASLLLLNACGQKPAPPVVETPAPDAKVRLASAIDQFAAAPADGTAAAVDKAFAEYNIEISDLKLQRDGTEAQDLAELQLRISEMETHRDAEAIRYQAARVDAGLESAKDSVRESAESTTEKAKEAAESAMESAKETTERAGEKAEEKAKEAGEALKEAGEKADQTLQDAGKKIEEIVTP